MWEIVMALIVGAAIPIIIQYIQTKEKEKFKLVAIEKRLEAHQQALKQWSILQYVIHKKNNEEKTKIISDVRNFWLSNSLYLEKETRKKFKDAIWIVSSYSMWLEMYRKMEPGKEKEDHKKFFTDCWNDFHQLFEIIQKEVELEPIKPIEDRTPEGEEIMRENKGKN